MILRNLIIFVLILITIFALCVFFSFKEELILDGEKYHLKIGQDKKEVYAQINNFLKEVKNKNDRVFIDVKITGQDTSFLATDVGYSIMVEPMFHQIGFEHYKYKDNWTFYLNASYLNFINLKFCENALCEIYRKKQPFELP